MRSDPIVLVGQIKELGWILEMLANRCLLALGLETPTRSGAAIHFIPSTWPSKRAFGALSPVVALYKIEFRTA